MLRRWVQCWYADFMELSLKSLKQLGRRYPKMYTLLKTLTGVELKKNLKRKSEWIDIHRGTAPQNLSILSFGGTDRATFENVKSQAATFSQMQSKEYLKWCGRLREEPNFHRKSWEYMYILKALEQNNKLQKGMKGLGFGVGQEPIVAYMVAQGCSVVATDLNPAMAIEKGWMQSGEYAKKLLDLNPRSVCSDKALQSHVTHRYVDMNHVPDDLLKEQFDFIWSACAIEHVGSIEKSMEFVVNSLKALKPGGVAVHTTEFNLSSNEETITEGGTVVFRKQDIETLAHRLRHQGCDIELNFDLGEARLDKYYDIAPFSDFHHLRLQLDKFVITSYGLLIQKKK
jgi:cyclopropane fatty-acyl-phospholipid synthase-like methyltransferase